jgi:DNA-binding FrmR family transcriptional regulator
MNCQEINSQLGALIDQELEPAQASMAQRHLKHCTECRGELERFRALKTALRSVESPTVSAHLDERVMTAFLLERRRATAISKVSGWRVWLYNSFAIPKPALALIAALLVGTAALAYKAGEIMGMRLPAFTPVAIVSDKSGPPRQATEPARVVYIKTQGGCWRPNSRPSAILARTGASKPAGKPTGAQAAVSQFETQTSASEAGIDYTTRAAIENLEPVKDAGIRVIKGENQ